MTDMEIQRTIVAEKPNGWRIIRILMLSWEYPPNIVGGLSRHVSCLSVHLAKLGYEVHVVTAGNGDLPEFELIEGVNVHRVKPLNSEAGSFLEWIAELNLAMAFKGEELAETMDFDLIHAHDWLVGAAATVCKEIFQIPLLTTIHATEHGRHNGIYTEVQKFIHDKEIQLIDASDEIIVCSEYMKEDLVTTFKTDRKKITVIPNGIDPLKTEIDVPLMFPELAERKYIFAIGRMVKEKGFETIIEAAAIAKEKKEDLFFIIAGKGPMLDLYRKKIEARNLAEHVLFVGYVTDEERNSLISGSELVVIPSIYEPFGIVALESMILGKPTIVSDTGGLKGMIKHLQTGMLMVPGDPYSLLEQIHLLLSRPELSARIGIKGRKAAERLYSWERIAVETSRLIEDVWLMNKTRDGEIYSK